MTKTHFILLCSTNSNTRTAQTLLRTRRSEHVEVSARIESVCPVPRYLRTGTRASHELLSISSKEIAASKTSARLTGGVLGIVVLLQRSRRRRREISRYS